MLKLALACVVGLVAGTAHAEDVVLRDMGSFHVGGKLVEVSGKPVRDVVFTPGGAPAPVDPNGAYVVGQMYVQYFVPAEQKGSVPLLMWHGGGSHGGDVGDDAGRADGVAGLVPAAGLAGVCVGCGGARGGRGSRRRTYWRGRRSS